MFRPQLMHFLTKKLFTSQPGKKQLIYLSRAACFTAEVLMFTLNATVYANKATK